MNSLSCSLIWLGFDVFLSLLLGIKRVYFLTVLLIVIVAILEIMCAGSLIGIGKDTPHNSRKMGKISSAITFNLTHLDIIGLHHIVPSAKPALGQSEVLGELCFQSPWCIQE